MNNNNQPIIILGIHDGHNAGAALVVDGNVVAAIGEERLNNKKNCAEAPKLAIQKVFEISGIHPSQVTKIAIASYIRVEDPKRFEGKTTYYPVQLLSQYSAPLLRNPWLRRAAVKILHSFRNSQETLEAVKTVGLSHAPIEYVEHHLAHAACAYYQRPWDDKTLVLTLDGMGDGLSATVNIGKGTTLTRIAETSFYDSVGNNLYSDITEFLGMKRNEHEYKLMGLAPYGKPDGIIDELRRIIRVNPDHPLTFENTSGKYLRGMQALYPRLLSGIRFDHIAAATQLLFEELVLSWVGHAIRETGIHKLAVSGGSFLNVKVNKRIRELPDVEDAFFYPAADDGGSPVGAALEAYYRYCEKNNRKAKRFPLTDLYCGQNFDDDRIREFLKSKRLLKKAKRVDATDVAKRLARGEVIARFAGRDEWGPRALGNRSIMADPRNLAITRKINMAIKQRDFWMPFTPSILAEYQSQYLKKSRFAPYMIEAFDTKPKAQNFIAALHPYDLTARPQTVNDWNPGWQAIIGEFYKQTGVPAILNTSFNLHGYPLCGTPEIAYWTFKNSALDGLLLNNYLIVG